MFYVVVANFAVAACRGVGRCIGRESKGYEESSMPRSTPPTSHSPSSSLAVVAGGRTGLGE